MSIFDDMRLIPESRAYACLAGRVWEEVNGQCVECPWSCQTRDGRVQTSIPMQDGSRKQHLRSRWVYRAYHGSIPSNQRVDHKDDNNTHDAPHNLQLLTNGQNTQKGFDKHGPRQHRGVIVAHRDGRTEIFVNVNACAKAYDVDHSSVVAAIRRGGYGRYPNTTFANMVLNYA